MEKVVDCLCDTIFALSSVTKKASPCVVHVFDSVILTSSEQKKCIIKRFHLKLFLYHSSQSIYPSPQISIPRCKKYLAGSEILQYVLNAVQIARIVSLSAPGYISAFIFALCIVAAGFILSSICVLGIS